MADNCEAGRNNSVDDKAVGVQGSVLNALGVVRAKKGDCTNGVAVVCELESGFAL